MNGKFCRGSDSHSPFSSIESRLDDGNIDELSAFFNQLNGFFAVVIQKDQTVLAAVDRVRSIPLFYGQAEGRIFLSDDAEWVRSRVGDSKMDPVSRKEFLFTGYVTGQETLFPRVHQLQAGEMLRVVRNGDSLHLQMHRYYRFLHTESRDPVDEDSLLAELDAVSEKCVQRLIDYADGRQIVVPLSAGYDSRLIVTILRRLGYENVIAFSYGVPGNRESTVSRAVAESLNYTWEFVPYSNKRWRDWWNSKERMEYQWWASGWTSLPVFQDWPAVWELRKAGKVEKDCVFVPGHTGDFISGGHIPHTIDAKDKGSLGDLSQSIISKHYCNTRWNENNTESCSRWHDRIIKVAEAKAVRTKDDIANWFEKWEWQERQAKFIINSVRVYEFWGFDWYLPLWDRDFMTYWQAVPLCFRKNKNLYDKFVNIAYTELCNSPYSHELVRRYSVPKNQPLKIKLRNFIKKALHSIPSEQKKTIKKMARPLGFFISYYSNNKNLALCGQYPMSEYAKLHLKGFGINGMLALFFMQEISQHFKK